MAKDEKKQAEKAPEKPAEAPAKKGPPVKLIGTVGVIVVAQAIITFAVFSMVGPKKSDAHVDEHAIKHDDGSVTKEIAIIKDKDGQFQNSMSGTLFVWSADIYVQVKARNADSVENKLKIRSAEVKEELSRIFGKAQHAHLKEPDRQTLNRQITATLNKIFGNDEKGESLIERVLIPKCSGYPMPL